MGNFKKEVADFYKIPLNKANAPYAKNVWADLALRVLLGLAVVSVIVMVRDGKPMPVIMLASIVLAAPALRRVYAGMQ